MKDPNVGFLRKIFERQTKYRLPVQGFGTSSAVIADAVLDEATSDHTTAGTVGQTLHRIQNDAMSSPTADSLMAKINTNLDETVSAAKTKKVTKTTGTFAHANNTNEQDVLEFTTLDELVTVSLDMTNLAQTTTVRVYDKVDGTNYKKIIQNAYPTDYTNLSVVELKLDGKGRDMKITFQSGTGEGSSKNVPHARIEELRST